MSTTSKPITHKKSLLADLSPQMEALDGEKRRIPRDLCLTGKALLRNKMFTRVRRQTGALRG